jgi:hypothetical protein
LLGFGVLTLDRNLRPSIREAIHVLNFEAPLPILPSDMPGTTHLAPAANRPSMSLSMSNIASDYEGKIESIFKQMVTHSYLSTSCAATVQLLYLHHFFMRAKLVKGTFNLEFLWFD